jgi:IS4 transposase
LDSTTIDLCLSLFPWAKFRKTKAAVKLHTLLALQGNFPTLVIITSGKVHDVNILDDLVFDPGAFYVMDRGYVDFRRLHRIHRASAFFVTRAKTNFQFRRRYSSPVDKATGIRFDQTVVLTGFYSHRQYPDTLRRIGYTDTDIGKTLIFLTNNMTEPAITIAQLYRCRWQVELFFKWIKQHLRIKSFYGTSATAVKTQIWIAICVYVLIAILRKSMSPNSTINCVSEGFKPDSSEIE